MKTRWITAQLGTGAYADVDRSVGAVIIDVRDLVDKTGNEATAVREKIAQGVNALRNRKKVIVCCDYGMSRSNAVATGILASFENKNFDDALRQVLEATGETDIKLAPLVAVRKALGGLPDKKPPDGRRPILVTGGSGFIGQTLTAALSNDFRIVAPSRDALDVSLGSTQLYLLAEQEDVGSIVHLANPRIYSSYVAMGKTLTMLRHVIDVCIARDIPLIYPSCWEIYAGYTGTLRVKEFAPPLPLGPFGETKYLAEVLIGHCIRTAGLRCGLLRFGTVYGKGGGRPKFMFNFIEKALRSQPIVTHRYKNGEPRLDFLHIDDLISAIISVITKGFTGTLNLGTGILTSTRHAAQLIVDKLDSDSTIEHSDTDTDVACIAMDSRNALKKIGWDPKISLETGIDDILSGIGSRRDAENG